jgi:flagellar biosynthesis anti-sigma factor FlgM
MKIEESNQQTAINVLRNERVEQVAGKDGKPSEAVAPRQPGKDNVDLSPAVEHLNKATSVQEVPEFRADRVAELKAKIDASEYKVSSRDVAEKVLNKLAKGPTT